MSHFEPGIADADAVTYPFDGSAPEVPPQLGQLLQQLFVALEDYMSGAPEAMPNLQRSCQVAVSLVTEPLRQAHWAMADTLLLVRECIRRLKHDDPDALRAARRLTWLEAQLPDWVGRSYHHPGK